MIKTPLQPRTSIERPCQWCKKMMWVQKHQIRKGSGKYCSRACSAKGKYTPEVRAKMSRNWTPREP